GNLVGNNAGPASNSRFALTSTFATVNVHGDHGETTTSKDNDSGFVRFNMHHNTGIFGVPGEPPTGGQIVKRVACSGEDLERMIKKHTTIIDSNNQHFTEDEKESPKEQQDEVPATWCDYIAEEILINLFLTHAAKPCVAQMTRAVFFLGNKEWGDNHNAAAG
ncbi:unnamed protein product, partial [Amoebophrya sp. A120]